MKESKEQLKKVEPKKTKIKFLAGNQMGITAGAVVLVGTPYAKECESKGWGEIVETKK